MGITQDKHFTLDLDARAWMSISIIYCAKLLVSQVLQVLQPGGFFVK